MAKRGWVEILVSGVLRSRSDEGRVSQSLGMKWWKLRSDNLALETGGRRSVRIDDDRVQRADWVLIWEKRYDGCWCWRRVKVMERSL